MTRSCGGGGGPFLPEPSLRPAWGYSNSQPAVGVPFNLTVAA